MPVHFLIIFSNGAILDLLLRPTRWGTFDCDDATGLGKAVVSLVGALVCNFSEGAAAAATPADFLPADSVEADREGASARLLFALAVLTSTSFRGGETPFGSREPAPSSSLASFLFFLLCFCLALLDLGFLTSCSEASPSSSLSKGSSSGSATSGASSSSGSSIRGGGTGASLVVAVAFAWSYFRGLPRFFFGFSIISSVSTG